jgi:hypothetical protein
MSFLTRRPGCLATEIKKDSERWAQKLVVAPMCHIVNNVQQFVKLWKFSFGRVIGWNSIVFTHFHKPACGSLAEWIRLQYNGCALSNRFALCIHCFNRSGPKCTTLQVCQWHAVEYYLDQLMLRLFFAQHLVVPLGNLPHLKSGEITTTSSVWVIQTIVLNCTHTTVR